MKIFVKKWYSDKRKRCIVCDMFGVLGNKSKLIFYDFVVVSVEDYFKIIEFICILLLFELYFYECDDYKDENGKFKGYKIYNYGEFKSVLLDNGIWIEVVKFGVRFEGEIWFRVDLK